MKEKCYVKLYIRQPCHSQRQQLCHTPMAYLLLSDVESSFPVIDKVGNVGIFVLLRYEKKLDTEINHLHNCFQLFPLEIVQKCQYIQICVLRENLGVDDQYYYNA